MNDPRQALRESLIQLKPLLDNLSNFENQVIFHKPIIKASDETRAQLEKYNKSKSKQKKKGRTDEEIEERERELEFRHEMDTFGTKMYNLASETSQHIESLRVMSKDDLRLIASLRYTAFRLVEASSEAKPRMLMLETRLLIAVSAAISSLTSCESLEAAQDLAHLGAQYNESVIAYQSAVNPSEQKERNGAIMDFRLARLELEYRKGNDNLALNLVIEAREPDITENVDVLQYQKLIMTCWSFSQDLIARQTRPESLPQTTTPVEWLQQALSFIKTIIDLGLYLPHITKIQSTVLKCMLREQIQDTPNNSKSLSDAESTIAAIIEVTDPKESVEISEILFLHIHLLLRAKGEKREIQAVCDRLIEVIEWTDNDISRLLSQLHALSTDYSDLTANITNTILIRALSLEVASSHTGTIVYEGLFFARQYCASQPSAAYPVSKLGQQTLLGRTIATASQMLLVNIASNTFEEKDCLEEAAQWYLLAVHPTLKAASKGNVSRCRGKAALCLIRSGNLTTAQELIRQCSPNEAATQYLNYLVAEKQGDIDGAKAAVEAFMSCPDVGASQVALITSIANTGRHRPLLSAILQSLLIALESPHLKDDIKIEGMAVVRDELGETVRGYLDWAVSVLSEDSAKYRTQTGVIAWISKSAYNMAVEGLGDISVNILADLFERSASLMELCGDIAGTGYDPELNRTKLFAMFGCFCGKMLLYRALTNGEEKNVLQAQLIQYLSIIQEEILRLTAGPYPESITKMDDLLEFYRVELLCDAKDWENIKEIIHRQTDRHDEAENDESFKVLEMMAKVLYEQEDCPPGLTDEILQTVLMTATLSTSADIIRFSRWVRGIFLAVLQQNRPISHENIKLYIDRVIAVLRSPLGRQAYPDDEMQWLLSSLWNKGLDEYHSYRAEEAKMWFDMSMKLGSCMPEGIAHHGEVN
ncbi:uncharacterized protein IL334_007385 [Kwoniella shivajii]|uniref:Protein ZIP4 homolog n=1 Tax=Kwoniella shivajii TaxID=564305 RepID=A0ABZ1D8I3_9TREE|nr:hypothetical protein IL334_007385 [Kwoniella shivajii]